MRRVLELNSIGKQYVIQRQKHAEYKDAEHPSSSSLRMNRPFRSPDSLGFQSLLCSIHNKPNVILKPIQSQRTTIKDSQSIHKDSNLDPSYILNVMVKDKIGISSFLDVIGSGSINKNTASIKEVSKYHTSSRGQPHGGLIPLRNKSSICPLSLRVDLVNMSSGDLVSSFIPLFLFSFIYFSSYSVNDLLSILENYMGLNPIWLKEMLGITSGGPCYDITQFSHQNESIHDISYELEKGLSNVDNYQFFRLVALVAGSVGVGVIVLWLASNGSK